MGTGLCARHNGNVVDTIKKTKDLLRKLNFMLTSRQKKYAVLVLVMSMAAALLETVGVAVVMPVLDMMLDIRGVRTRWYMEPFVRLFQLDTDGKIIWFVCLGVVGIYIVKTLYFVFYTWVSTKYSYMVQRELSVRMMEAYMKQGYQFFLDHNTAWLLNGVSNDTASIYNGLKSIFTCVTKLLTVLCIVVYIMMQSVRMALVLMLLAALCLVGIQLIYRKPMSRNGIRRREILCEMNQYAVEAIQGHKEVLVMNKQKFFANAYEEARARYSRAAAAVDMGTSVPSFLIEVVCVAGVLVAVAVEMGRTANPDALITQMSSIAIGAFRILPALGAVTSGINMIVASMPHLNACYEMVKLVAGLEKKDEGKTERRDKYGQAEFQKELALRSVTFRYPSGEENILENVDFTVKKGEAVALIGPSGAGKTTTSDIILALLKPTSGKVLMDGINVEDLGDRWNRIIGYVPQFTYIIDDSIRHNIAFGEKEKSIDDGQIWRCLEIAQLDEFVRTLPEGLETMVGERGVRFSGGQRQRLAIARALYRDPDILVLDEATASLDNETEAEFMRAIEALQGTKTLIIVAHRLTTVRSCDAIYEVNDRKIVKKDKAEIFGEA